MKFFFLLLLSLTSGSGALPCASSFSQSAAAGSSQPHRQLGEETTGHEYLKFGLGWGPGYCRIYPCKYKPERFFGTALKQQDGARKETGHMDSSASVVLTMGSDLVSYIPDVKFSTKGELNISYYKMMYNKFGMNCTELRSASDYFQLMIDFTRTHSVGLYNRFLLMGIKPSRTNAYSLKRMHQIVDDYFGSRGQVWYNIIGRKHYLSLVKICSDLKGERFVDCSDFTYPKFADKPIYFPEHDS